MLVVATHVTQAPNDKEQLAPLLETPQAQSATRNEVKQLITDTGYASEKNIHACENGKIDPLLAVAREEAPSGMAGTAQQAAPVAGGRHANAGHGAQAQDPSWTRHFGIIKQVMGFRQFSLRELDSIGGEWTLVCLAWNVKRMAVLLIWLDYPGHMISNNHESKERGNVIR